VPAADRLAEKARTEPARRKPPLLGAFAGLLEAAVRRRQRRPAEALAVCERAAATFEAAGETAFLAAARRERALALAEAGRAAEAELALGDVPADADSQLVRARVALARGATAEALRAATAAAAAFAAGRRAGEGW